ncbi:MAG TPA: L-histidine N(alpha)-methyltransferase [Sphingobacteriaceae bacterium]
MNQFLQDVLTGLNATPKYLHSKYLYDGQGDILFEEIMHSQEYYVTDCEMEIFQTQCERLCEYIKSFFNGFDVIELGAGDGIKSYHLLKCLQTQNTDFTYYPIDISTQMIGHLEETLPEKIPGLKVNGLNGDYFDMLEEATRLSDKPKVVLFLGANIGNMPPPEAEQFCRKLHSLLQKGDLVLMGFDLQKNPWVIFNAYNDHGGITREFNLNLLRRINTELGADFDLDHFEHYENYDPETGACKSYIISLKEQVVHIDKKPIKFKENEYVFTETSQKYRLDETDELAVKTGFKPLDHLFDSKKWFTDVLWEVV